MVLNGKTKRTILKGLLGWVSFGNTSLVIALNETLGKESCAQVSRRLYSVEKGND